MLPATALLVFAASLSLGLPTAKLGDDAPAFPVDSISAWSWVEGSKDGRWYALTLEPGSFAHAEGEALLAGGHLVTVDSSRESKFLVKAFGFAKDATPEKHLQSMWIGLRRRIATDDYVWTSGETKISDEWLDKQPNPEPTSSAWATFIAGGEDVRKWREVTDKNLELHGIIEIEFDPTMDPLTPYKAKQKKAEDALASARAECLDAALEDAEKIDIKGALKELDALRKAKAAIIHAKRTPSSAETVAASAAVQDWIEVRIEEWGEKSRRVRLAISNYTKLHGKAAKGQVYGMTERAARVDIFCAMLRPERGAVSHDTHYLNRRVALRTQMTKQNFEIVSWTNEHRQMMGVPVLLLDSRVTYGAQIHANDMAALGFFEHESPVPGRTSFGDRCREAGYTRGSGENLHQGGSAGINSVMGWIGSPGHHSNMLQSGHGTIGPGISGGYSVQVFGAPPRKKK